MRTINFKEYASVEEIKEDFKNGFQVCNAPIIIWNLESDHREFRECKGTLHNLIIESNPNEVIMKADCSNGTCNIENTFRYLINRNSKFSLFSRGRRKCS